MKKVIVKNCLANYRSKHNMTQSDLAESCEVSKNTISSIERGEFFPALRLALKIAFLFGVKVEDIFWLDLEG